jgi:hypothetical protein
MNATVYVPTDAVPGKRRAAGVDGWRFAPLASAIRAA